MVNDGYVEALRRGRVAGACAVMVKAIRDKRDEGAKNSGSLFVGVFRMRNPRGTEAVGMK